MGAGGRLGLPLSVLFAEAHPDCHILGVDHNPETLAVLQKGEVPFREAELATRLAAARRRGLSFQDTLPDLSPGDAVALALPGCLASESEPQAPLLGFCRNSADQLAGSGGLLLFSTLAPGMYEDVVSILRGGRPKSPPVAYAPERFAEGQALREMVTLPQIIAGKEPEDLVFARRLLEPLNRNLIEADVAEAEMLKLLTNSWRYLVFGAANQLYSIATEAGLDFVRLSRLMREGYPRLADLPSAGFAAGPCLPNDVRILLQAGHSFPMGAAALALNEGFPEILAGRLAAHHQLNGARIGVLGAAFKAESDDVRGALTPRLVEVLRRRGAEVRVSDPWVTADDLVAFDDLVAWAEALVVAVPHQLYNGLCSGRPTLDPWGVVSEVDRL